MDTMHKLFELMERFDLKDFIIWNLYNMVEWIDRSKPTRKAVIEELFHYVDLWKDLGVMNRYVLKYGRYYKLKEEYLKTGKLPELFKLEKYYNEK